MRRIELMKQRRDLKIARRKSENAIVAYKESLTEEENTAGRRSSRIKSVLKRNLKKVQVKKRMRRVHPDPCNHRGDEWFTFSNPNCYNQLDEVVVTWPRNDMHLQPTLNSHTNFYGSFNESVSTGGLTGMIPTNQNYDFSGASTGLFGAKVINAGFNYKVNGFLKANPFKTIPTEIRYIQRGSSFLGGTIATLNVGLAYNDYRNDEIGLGKFGYRSAAAGGSWYLASLYGGPAGIAAGGAFGLGELMYDANVVSVRLRKEISMQEKHPHRIENKNIFSKGFWSEISRQMTSGNWINGFSY